LKLYKIDKKKRPQILQVLDICVELDLSFCEVVCVLTVLLCCSVTDGESFSPDWVY